ncbi:DUF2946 family protein [Sneathiella chinensis]|uniref:DUF2946 family protein n=1 Tax=Sneathiella chinensis TaxID=349750 RepID=UPI00146DF3FA|nr:DUF2946 family protein [Sneathiella chinensis]
MKPRRVAYFSIMSGIRSILFHKGHTRSGLTGNRIGPIRLFFALIAVFLNFLVPVTHSSLAMADTGSALVEVCTGGGIKVVRMEVPVVTPDADAAAETGAGMLCDACPDCPVCQFGAVQVAALSRVAETVPFEVASGPLQGPYSPPSLREGPPRFWPETRAPPVL